MIDIGILYGQIWFDQPKEFMDSMIEHNIGHCKKVLKKVLSGAKTGVQF